MHLNRQPKQVIQTLRLRLCLRNILPPHIHPMPSDQHRTRLRPLDNRLFQRIPQILLVRRIVNNRDPHRIEEAQITQFTTPLGDFGRAVAASGDAFDLLDLGYAEDGGGGVRGLLGGAAEEGHEDGPLRVRVDTAARAAVLVHGEEERGAGGWFEGL